MIRRIVLLLAAFAFAGSALADETGASRFLSIGGTVRISEPTQGDVLALGGTVDIDAPVAGDVRAAGGTVRLGPDAAVSGDVALAGGTVTVDGSIQGNVRAAGGDVRINGPVAGNLSIAAGTLALGPAARIDGKLTFHGGQLNRDPAAQVTGGVQHEESTHTPRHERTAVERFVHGWIWTAGFMLIAAIMAAALPGPSQRLARELRERPWITSFIGFLALMSVPVAAVLMMVTIIGIPLGILALFAYAALLLVGYVWLTVVVGGMLLDRIRPEAAARTAWRVGAAVLTMLVLGILVRVPFVGDTLRFLATGVGVGMVVAAMFRRPQPEELSPAT